MSKKYKQGIYVPFNKEKYIPVKNKMNNLIYPQYRSSYELKFFKYCDLNPKIIKWSSEPIAIPYISPLDNKKHRYFVDFYIIINNVKFLVEIKPYNQTIPPKNNNSTAFITYKINEAKWYAAKKFADDNDCKFVVLTEKELKI